jgi:DNA repair protein RecO (recombination protein O)
MKPRTNYKTQAIVLHSIDYGESDRIVTFYTAEYGKVTGIAKGARRSKKRFANVLETFACLELLFSRRSHDGLAFLEEGKAINHYPGICNNLKKTLYASYLAEITEQFTVEHKKNSELFYLLQGFLELLDQGSASEDLMRFFEMRLLKLVGYEPLLDRCLVCKLPVGDGDSYHFSVTEGGVKCLRCAPYDTKILGLSVGTIKSLLLGKDMEREKLCRLTLTEQCANESRALLGKFIEHLLGREIKSLRVIREIRELGI